MTVLCLCRAHQCQGTFSDILFILLHSWGGNYGIDHNLSSSCPQVVGVSSQLLACLPGGSREECTNKCSSVSFQVWLSCAIRKKHFMRLKYLLAGFGKPYCCKGKHQTLTCISFSLVQDWSWQTVDVTTCHSLERRKN